MLPKNASALIHDAPFAVGPEFHLQISHGGKKSFVRYLLAIIQLVDAEFSSFILFLNFLNFAFTGEMSTPTEVFF